MAQLRPFFYCGLRLAFALIAFERPIIATAIEMPRATPVYGGDGPSTQKHDSTRNQSLTSRQGEGGIISPKESTRDAPWDGIAVLATRHFGQLALSSRRACRRKSSLTPAKAPIDVRRRSYVAGPVHVRWYRTPDPLQQALYRDVRVLERGRQARPHASRNSPISGLIGQPVRHSRRVPPSAGHRSQRRQDDQQRARLRKWAENST